MDQFSTKWDAIQEGGRQLNSAATNKPILFLGLDKSTTTSSSRPPVAVSRLFGEQRRNGNGKLAAHFATRKEDSASESHRRKNAQRSRQDIQRALLSAESTSLWCNSCRTHKDRALKEELSGKLNPRQHCHQHSVQS